MSEPAVLHELQDGIAIVTLNRSQWRNGVTVDM